MDPSILKILDEDEDETMYPGADLDVYVAALSREISRTKSKSIPPVLEYAVKDKAPQMQCSRMGLSTSSSTELSSPVPRSITAQSISSGGHGNGAKRPLKRPPGGSLVSLSHQPRCRFASPSISVSKKQKVSTALVDQSIEQLNDVTAVGGVNLQEEEQQLFSGSKDDSRVSETSQRIVKEERLILQKTPLHNKFAEIMLRCGVKNMNGDVEQCLSLSVEERMRGLIGSLIRMLKQRVDIEKSSHQTLATSDIRKQIMAINQRAREEWDKKQSQAEKLQKFMEPENSGGGDVDKEKEVGCAKLLKVNKEEDDKMRTTAANVAARAAIGGDDMSSKWQQMAEQARQGKDISISHNPSSFFANGLKDNVESERRGQQNAAAVFGSSRKLAQTKIARSISIKDVIAVLEMEPQMSKREILFRLYEKSREHLYGNEIS